MIIDFVRALQAFLLFRESLEPDEYYASLTDPLFIAKTIFYWFQTMLGDSVIVSFILRNLLCQCFDPSSCCAMFVCLRLQSFMSTDHQFSFPLDPARPNWCLPCLRQVWRCYVVYSRRLLVVIFPICLILTAFGRSLSDPCSFPLGSR